MNKRMHSSSPPSNPDTGGYPGISKSPTQPSSPPASSHLPLKRSKSRSTFSQMTHTFEPLLAQMNNEYHMHVPYPVYYWMPRVSRAIVTSPPKMPRGLTPRSPRSPPSNVNMLEACFVHLATLPPCHLHGSCFNPHVSSFHIYFHHFRVSITLTFMEI